MASKAQDTDELISEINVTPLVDVILVLLIIFMLTANVIAKSGIEVELPEASTGAAVEATTLGLTLDKDGALYLDGTAISEVNLSEHLRGVAAHDKKAQAIIAADKSVSHGRVVALIDLVRGAGIYKFALNIEPAIAAAGVAP